MVPNTAINRPQNPHDMHPCGGAESTPSQTAHANTRNAAAKRPAEGLHVALDFAGYLVYDKDIRFYSYMNESEEKLMSR